MYGRVFKYRPVHFRAFWCTAGSSSPSAFAPLIPPLRFARGPPRSRSRGRLWAPEATARRHPPGLRPSLWEKSREERQEGLEEEWRLNELVTLTHILDAELEGGIASVVVLDDGVADVERIAFLDVVEVFGHIESYGRDAVVWL